MSKRPLLLSGFMATGKSTLGAALAARYGVPFVDTDDVVAREARASVADLWAREGEAAFREREARTIERLLDEPGPRVIALGGGAMTNVALRRAALERAILVTLRASPRTILARAGDLTSRPNLRGADPGRRIEHLLAVRAEAYAECHGWVDTDDVDLDAAMDAVDAIVRRDPLAVPLGSRTYTVDVVRDDPTRLTDAIASLGPSSLVVVSDSNVQRARHDAIEAALGPLVRARTDVTLAPGEANKNLTAIATLWDAALGAGVDRDAIVVAIGGGVVGDMAGFAASTLLRGLRVVQAPTSLLAMVDASVGGKTGFDHPTGKNLVGTFHQPSAVVVDLSHLATLPKRERACGLAEALKMGLLGDAALFERMERDADRLAAGDVDALLPVVRAAIQGKIRIVSADERESGVRAVLNVGHTVGHALESATQYTKWLHGEAVSIGIVRELELARRLDCVRPETIDRTVDVLRKLGLPTSADRADMHRARTFVAADKKRAGRTFRVPLIDGIGSVTMRAVSSEDMGRVFEL